MEIRTEYNVAGTEDESPTTVQVRIHGNGQYESL